MIPPAPPPSQIDCRNAENQDSDASSYDNLYAKDKVDVSGVASGSKLRVFYVVGGGGGHEFHLRDLRFEFSPQSTSSSYYGGDDDEEKPPDDCAGSLIPWAIALAVGNGVSLWGGLMLRSRSGRRLSASSGLVPAE